MHFAKAFCKQCSNLLFYAQLENISSKNITEEPAMVSFGERQLLEAVVLLGGSRALRGGTQWEAFQTLGMRPSRGYWGHNSSSSSFFLKSSGS
jgi:hypothetical protein